MSWRRDLKASNEAFMRLVWPMIANKCGGGQIKPVEVIDDNELARDLDIMCGIDIWQTVDGAGCRGIASRVQFGNKNWGTFTVRKSRDSGATTEYDKRMTAIKSNGRFIYPYLTCHSYVTEDRRRLVGGGLARTEDIFSAINDRTQVRRTSNAEFFAVRFCDVAGVYLFSDTGDLFAPKTHQQSLFSAGAA